MTTKFKGPAPLRVPSAEQTKEVSLNDLIGRNFEAPDLSDLALSLEGKTALITGAGGSIGSEMARQLAALPLKELVLVESSEYNLYKIMEELDDVEVSVVPKLVNICDPVSLEAVFYNHRPDFIYHAAAYKHVHIVEANPNSGILNNILGTLNLLNLADRFEVKKFTFISTDKAVRPANLMGATKRVGELLINEFAREKGLDCSSVRFGNVAGSSGSLIPKLIGQIKENRPLTITDKRMTRYFMLIPEAIGLVLKSSQCAHKGSVTLLNMGPSVPVIDIAKKLLKLSGKSPESYPIVFTGKRPGEKLYEELSLDAANIFKGGRQFAALTEGDRPFKDFIFNGKRYSKVSEAAIDMVFLARNGSDRAAKLLWAALQSEFETLEKTTEELGELRMPEVA